MKKLLFTISACVLSFTCISQKADPVNKNIMEDPMLPFYMTAVAVLFVMVLVIIVAAYAIRLLNMLTKQTARGNALKTGASYIKTSSWWDKFTQRMNASVPVAQEKTIVLDHNYDGITELDNHLPPWWKWLFYGSIGWAVVYIIVFHFTDTLPLSQEEYHNELALAEEQIKKFQASQPQSVVDENTLQYVNDPAGLEKGKIVFKNNNCGGCHRIDGGGNAIGPNLTDEYWMHGGAIKNIFLTIKNGAVEKGMPAWGKAMKPQDVRDVTFYILSLQGTHPPDPKAPQGEMYKQNLSIPRDSSNVQAGL